MTPRLPHEAQPTGLGWRCRMCDLALTGHSSRDGECPARLRRALDAAEDRARRAEVDRDRMAEELQSREVGRFLGVG